MRERGLLTKNKRFNELYGKRERGILNRQVEDAPSFTLFFSNLVPYINLLNISL
jgi:hypothetical protein